LHPVKAAGKQRAPEEDRMDGEAPATAITQANRFGSLSIVRSVAIWGPGIVVMLADTDAGNVVTASQSGAQSGYRLLPLVLLLIPMLYMLQELTVRLGTTRAAVTASSFGRGSGWAGPCFRPRGLRRPPSDR
jgi:hypothetical protein